MVWEVTGSFMGMVVVGNDTFETFETFIYSQFSYTIVLKSGFKLWMASLFISISFSGKGCKEQVHRFYF